jgi:hypothetical protein
MLGRRRGIDEGMLDTQGSFEGDEGGVGELDDDDLGSEKQTAEVLVRHRFRAPAVGLL